METATISKQEIYFERVNDLFLKMKNWLNTKDFKFQETNVTVIEKNIKYIAPSIELTILEKNLNVKIVPMGCYIIGAEGRVDIVGELDSTIIVFLKKGGPSVSIQEQYGNPNRRTGQPRLFFKNINDDGWYWIEDKRLGRAKPIDKELFLDLIRWVSYEF